MFLGRVIGTVWSTKKDEQLVGAKFLIVRELDLELKEKDRFVVAVDSVGAGEGDDADVYVVGPDLHATRGIGHGCV